jgi:hypothetical protein
VLHCDQMNNDCCTLTVCDLKSNCLNLESTRKKTI